MIRNRRVEYLAIRLSVRSFARIAHSFARSVLIASFVQAATLICSLTHSLASLWERGSCLCTERLGIILFLTTVHLSLLRSLSSRRHRVGLPLTLPVLPVIFNAISPLSAASTLRLSFIFFFSFGLLLLSSRFATSFLCR